MRRGMWVKGASAGPLAERWGLDEATVRHDSAEASRVVAREVRDPEGMRVEVASVLRENLHKASAVGEFKAVASLGDVVTKILGARAPERHEHAHIVTTYEAKSPKERAQWLREKASLMLAEADRLDGVVSVQVDASALPEPR